MSDFVTYKHLFVGIVLPADVIMSCMNIKACGFQVFFLEANRLKVSPDKIQLLCCGGLPEPTEDSS